MQGMIVKPVEIKSTPIIGAPSATLSQMQTWAKAAKATPTFVDLAKVYWDLASSHGGVDPVIAYAQAAKETAYGRFGGVLDDSYHNPCGLKTAKGVDDKPEDHQVFDTWEKGVQAHLDHLALYAGAEGYPRKDTTDPRHFPYLIGKVENSVEKLSGNWAPSKSYGDEIVKMAEKIKITDSERVLLPKLSINSPKDASKYLNEKSILITGWSINENEIKSINVYIDNKFIEKAEYGIETPELKKLYPEYSNVEKSGYKADVDISNLDYGNHSIKVESIDSNGNKISEVKNFQKVDLKLRLWVDYPSEKEVMSKNKLSLSGWAVSGKNIKNINVYLDNKHMGNAEYGTYRPDVNKVFPGYPSEDKSGYKFDLDTKLIEPGNYTIKVEAIDTFGNSIYEEKVISIKKLEHIVTLETNLDDNVYGFDPLEIKGIALDSSDIKEVEVFLNNSLLGNAKLGLESREALKDYPEYTNAGNSGYEYSIDNLKLNTGKNVIKVVSKANDGTKKEISKEINIAKANHMMDINSPEGIFGNSKILVNGWALNKSGIKNVEVYLDGKLLGNANMNLPRPDVTKVFKGYAGSDNSGYALEINENIPPGTHIILVKSIANNGESLTMIRKIEVVRLSNKMYIDDPSEGEEIFEQMIVRGWALNPSGVKQVKVFIDDIYAGDAEYGLSRPDVNEVFPLYSKGASSGYQIKLFTNNVKRGEHKVTVEAVGQDGSSTKVSKKISMKKLEPLSYIDSPEIRVMKKEKLNIYGWSLNDSGIQKVKVFIDGKYIGNAKYGLNRPDVKAVFPKYKYTEESGYTLDYDVSNLSIGNHEVKIECIGNDGSTDIKTKSFEIFSDELRGWLDNPLGDIKGRTIDVNGWALSQNDIKSVEVYIDKVKVGNSKYGSKRSDADNLFPGYPVGENCGFSYKFNTDNLKAGNHEVKVVVTDNKNNKIEKVNSFNLIKLDAKMYLEAPFQNNDNLYGETNIMFRGWAISDSGIKELKIELDGVPQSNVSIGKIRPDVQNAFKEYENTLFSGYEYELRDIDKLSQGYHKIEVKALSNDGTVDSRTINFTIKQNRVIVVDPGHNHGGDYGAVSNIGGIRYSETDLNMQVSMKLKESLENEGYTVYLTRGPLDFLYDNLNTSIANRYTIANNLNAEAFISIHHDSSSDSNAKGVSTFYSSFKPGLDNVDIVKGVDPNGYGWYDFQMDLTPTQEAIKGRELARNIVNGVSSNMGYYNRREHDRGLGVTRETNMPAVLVECGFISNLEDARRASNPNNQKELANNIAREVKRTLK
ncbi:Ig-like domain-containing protein [Clostridium algidicarnis]|nr:N-acetylmuramoyl-L-alanine amidase [Clostridium algidicarnis]